MAFEAETRVRRRGEGEVRSSYYDYRTTAPFVEEENSVSVTPRGFSLFFFLPLFLSYVLPRYIDRSLYLARNGPRFFAPSSRNDHRKEMVERDRGETARRIHGITGRAKFFLTSGTRYDEVGESVLEYPLLRAISRAPRPQSEEENDCPNAISQRFLPFAFGSFLI